MKRPSPQITLDSGRIRRSRHEVDRLILESARMLFASKGYAGTTTKEVAEQASVHEPMVYRRFDSKAKLFEAAVLIPFDEAVSAYLDAHPSQSDRPEKLEDLVRAFVDPLYKLMSDHSDLVLTLISGHGVPEEIVNGNNLDENLPLFRILRRMQPQLEIEAARRGLRIDSPTTVLIVIAMVLGLTLLETTALHHRPDWISHRRRIDEAVNMILFGVGAHPDTRDEGIPREFSLLLDRAIDAERRAIRAEMEVARLREMLTRQGRSDEK